MKQEDQRGDIYINIFRLLHILDHDRFALPLTFWPILRIQAEGKRECI